jgi:hypothetical protein
MVLHALDHFLRHPAQGCPAHRGSAVSATEEGEMTDDYMTPDEEAYVPRDDSDATMYLFQQEREETALRALMECKRAGTDLAVLQTLAIELGLLAEWNDYQNVVRP